VPIDPWSAPPPADSWGAPPAEGDAAPVAEDEKGDDDRKFRDRDQEEEDNTISYEQYLAQMKDNTTTSVPKLEGVREANEGANDAWGDVVEHKKNEDDQAYYVGKVCWVRDKQSPTNTQYLQTKATGKVRAEKKEKVYIEIDTHFERPSRGGRRGGGDRGRGRGGRGTRGPRSNGAQRDVNVDDETVFPSLS
jgi:plasminogen activator inhibitor 1 RNA-binding protein